MNLLVLIRACSVGLLLSACLPQQDSRLNHDNKPHNHPETVEAVTDPASLSYWKDIKPLFAAKCESCHSEGGLAPFELTEYSAVKSFRKGIKRAVSSRTMPPWSADPGHQSYKDDLSLSDKDISTIVSWIDAGAVEGKAADYVSGAKASFQSDLNIPIFSDGGSYLPNQTRSDDYRCFLLPIGSEFSENSYVTGFTTVPGNAKIVHHLVAYVVTPQAAKLLQVLDEKEEGRGYQCFGGAIPDALGNPDVQKDLEASHPGALDMLNKSNYWLAHWAPGMDGGFTFPEDTGIKILQGGAIVVQMHYYSADAKGESDSGTTMGLKLAKTVKKPAFYYPLTKQEWVLSKKNQSMVIPANSDATFQTEKNLANIAAYGKAVLGLGNAQVKNVELHSANLHMHEIGHSGKVTLAKKDVVEEETLLSISTWDLHWQRDYQFAAPKVIPAADLPLYTKKLSCTFSNGKAEDVFGGFGSMDEMCFDFGFVAFDLEAAAQ